MDSFKLIGKKLRKKTKNMDGQSGKDCGELWQYFESQHIAAAIPDKESNTVYAVYFDYESDENGLFDYFVGCKVKEDTLTPSQLDELMIPRQSYHKETAKGKMPECITEAWKRIWNGDIPRKFGYDLEVYDERSMDWENATVDLFISIIE